MNDICKKRATKAFGYFCEILGIDRTKVVLRFVDPTKLNENEGVENVYGDTETVACVEMPGGRRKRYCVSLSNREGISGDLVVESVAHELIHVTQTYEFNGVKYDTFETHMDYFTAPWEIEARLKSRKMVVDFNRYMRENAAHKLIKKLN